MARTVVLRHGERDYRVEIDGDVVRLNGTAVALPRQAWTAADGDTRWVFLNGEAYEFEVQRSGTRRSAGHHGSLAAPMPATVRKVLVQPGSEIRKGDTLLVLEAMKMELPLRAPSEGVVKTVACREGDLVQPGVVLVEIE